MNNRSRIRASGPAERKNDKSARSRASNKLTLKSIERLGLNSGLPPREFLFEVGRTGLIELDSDMIERIEAAEGKIPSSKSSKKSKRRRQPKQYMLVPTMLRIKCLAKAAPFYAPVVKHNGGKSSQSKARP